MYDRWNYLLSDKFCVTNIVKQGGILSPLLFDIYMGGLSISLNEKAISSFIKILKFNHLMFADDMILFSPSVKGLKYLINVCHGYGASDGITFNKAKTVCMHVLSNKVRWTTGSPCVKLSTERTSFVKQITYLGHNQMIMICYNYCVLCTVSQIRESEDSLSVLRKCIVELCIVVVFGVAIRN